MIRVSLVGVRVEVPSNQPIVLLREDEGGRYLPIFIGPPEATAIVYALQGLEIPRPMTHDLLNTLLDELSVRLVQVEITRLDEGTFFAEITFERDGSSMVLSARPSDAIALAVRSVIPVPLFVNEEVMEEAGVVFDAEDDEDSLVQIEQFKEFLDHVSPEDFIG